MWRIRTMSVSYCSIASRRTTERWNNPLFPAYVSRTVVTFPNLAGLSACRSIHIIHCLQHWYYHNSNDSSTDRTARNNSFLGEYSSSYFQESHNRYCASRILTGHRNTRGFPVQLFQLLPVIVRVVCGFQQPQRFLTSSRSQKAW